MSIISVVGLVAGDGWSRLELVLVACVSRSRLEREIHSLGGIKTPSDPACNAFDVVHCYGHGGAGMSIAWGCAGDVARLAVEAATERGAARI